MVDYIFYSIATNLAATFFYEQIHNAALQFQLDFNSAFVLKAIFMHV